MVIVFAIAEFPNWLIAAIITHILGLAPIVFIQISLDKVLNYGAVSTLYILIIGVCSALIFSGILSYVRDYVINFISTSFFCDSVMYRV